MEKYLIFAIIIEGIIILALTVGIIVALVKRKHAKNNVKIVDGVRLTTNANITTEDGETSITLVKGDTLLMRGRRYNAFTGGALLPGKYTVLSVAENVRAVNIRVGGIVREYKHGSDLVLADGEEICAVSHSVILR